MKNAGELVHEVEARDKQAGCTFGFIIVSTNFIECLCTERVKRFMAADGRKLRLRLDDVVTFLFVIF